MLCTVPIYSDTTVVQRNLEPIAKIKMQFYVSFFFSTCDVAIFFPETQPKLNEWQNVEIQGKWDLCINKNWILELFHM